jgi:hypothetical protein
MNVELVGDLMKKLPIEDTDDFTKFQYKYLDSRLTNDTFQKVFEMRGDSQYFYVFTHNNKMVNR